MTYTPAGNRYDTMTYRRAGRSGLRLPAISLGLWHNFGAGRPWDRQRAIVRRAFDLGVTHFDLANNYGPPPGSAELNFGRVLATDLRDHRDETLERAGAGCIAFSPLQQGLLTDRYLGGIPADSRIRTSAFLDESALDNPTMARIHALDDIARRRGQSLAQMALAWALRDPRMTSLIIGASGVEQLENNIAALDNLTLSPEELGDIDGTCLDL